MGTASRNEACAELRRRVLTLELEPGANLDETRIGEEYGLSRTPVRDILRQLAGEGYVRIVDNRGASVSSMNHKTLRDFFHAAPPIYAMVARLAVRNAEPRTLEALKAAQRAFRRAARAGRVGELVAHNERFHALLGEMADNQFLLPTLKRLLIDHSRIAQTFYQKRNAEKGDRLALAVRQHDEMIEAIEAGDEERVVEVTMAHWELSRSQAEIFVHADPLPVEEAAPPAAERRGRA